MPPPVVLQGVLLSEVLIWSGPISVALLLLWSILGFHHHAQGSLGHTLNRRAWVNGFALLLCFAASLLSLFMNALVATLVAASFSMTAFLWHAACDPLKDSFWHHRRLRPLGVMLVLALSLGLSMIAGPHYPALSPLVFAIAIFQRHHKGLIRLTIVSLQDLESLRRRVLSTTVEHQLMSHFAISGQTADDSSQKAG